jgi:CIC family chloride channel protein
VGTGWQIGESGAYAAVGMAAVFAGAGRAPITAILILFEMTQGYEMILPLMTGVVVAGVAAQLMMKDSIYTLKLKRRGLDIEAKRPHSVLDYVVAGQVMSKKFDVVGPDLSIQDLLKMFKKSKQFAFPVLDSEGKLLSITTFQEVSQVIDLAEMGRVGDLPQSELITCYPDQTLAEVMKLVAGHDVSYVPVIDPNVSGKIVGILSRHDMMRAISKVTLDQAQKVEGLGDARVDEALKIIPFDLEKNSRFVGNLVKDLRFPPDVLLTSIRRRGQLIIPRGETQLEVDDRLAIQLPKGKEEVLQRYLAGEGEETIHGDALRSLSTTLDEHSELAGKKVMEIRFPADVLLTAIYRGSELIIPKGTTEIQAGDRIQVHFPREAKEALTEFLARQSPKE